MEASILKISELRIVFMLIIMALLSGCSRMSEIIRDKNAGFNGSFEITKSGLPVNWLVYTPETIPTGDCDLIIDTTEYKEGKQSLKFLVRECSQIGGWYSPGFCNEYPASPGEIFKISFWIMNKGTEYVVKIGGITTSKGKYDTIVRSDENSDEWKLIEYHYTIPENMKAIRFEMNVLKPGTFWIDDIHIENTGNTR